MDSMWKGNIFIRRSKKICGNLLHKICNKFTYYNRKRVGQEWIDGKVI